MKRRPPEEEGEGAWLISYGDLVTNLMAVFVMMTAISTVDPVKLRSITKSISDAVGGKSQAEPERNITQDLIDEIERLIKQAGLQDDISVTLTPDGVLLSAKGSAFFAAGQADLLPEPRKKIALIVEHLVKLPFHIEIIGHSDTVPIKTEQFPSNWELSGSRATNIVRYFVEKGFAPNHIRAIAAADTRPVAPDYSEDGTSLPENQALNRRIDMLIFSAGNEPEIPAPGAVSGEESAEGGAETDSGHEEAEEEEEETEE